MFGPFLWDVVAVPVVPGAGVPTMPTSREVPTPLCGPDAVFFTFLDGLELGLRTAVVLQAEFPRTERVDLDLAACMWRSVSAGWVLQFDWCLRDSSWCSFPAIRLPFSIRRDVGHSARIWRLAACSSIQVCV